MSHSDIFSETFCMAGGFDVSQLIYNTGKSIKTDLGVVVVYTVMIS